MNRRPAGTPSRRFYYILPLEKAQRKYRKKALRRDGYASEERQARFDAFHAEMHSAGKRIVLMNQPTFLVIPTAAQAADEV